MFDLRKGFISGKVEQAKSLAERLKTQPKGTNFDVSWAKTIEWRVVSPFVEFAWSLDEPLFDVESVPRVMQVGELLDYLAEGKKPVDPLLLTLIKKVRATRDSAPMWY